MNGKFLKIPLVFVFLIAELSAEIVTNSFKDDLVSIDFYYSQDENKRSYYKVSFENASFSNLIIEQKIGASKLMAAKFIKPSRFMAILKGEAAFFYYSYEYKDGAWLPLDEFLFSIPDSGLQNFLSSTNTDPFIPNFEILNEKEFVVNFSKSKYFDTEYVKLDHTLKKREVLRRAKKLPKNLNFKIADKKLLCNGSELERRRFGPPFVKLEYD